MQLPFQKYLGPLIARRRTKKIQEEYGKIGGGSPLEKWTTIQAQGMVEILDKECPETAPHQFYIGFRYNEPSIQTAVEKIRKDGMKRVVAFSQYFQYSCTTSGSNLNNLYKFQKMYDQNGEISWSFIDRWATNPLLVKVFATSIQKAIEKLPLEHRSTAPILFSAHSVPLRTVAKGDPYPCEVSGTVEHVVAELRNRNVKNPYRLIWQSKVGPLPWLEPATDKVITQLGASNCKACVISPIAFTSDHIETLFELGIEYRELAQKHGIEHYIVADPPNDNPQFIRCLAELVKSHLNGTDSENNQIFMRCPGCQSEQCEITKKWILNQRI
ncbi:Ferrochelatase, mitochondrial [Zancudomyces culisetae]|uniref:Ferrochelatase n=1 Tax=Zancudomyces culisetae TaxID=1213189 RepID=A0A1R1PZ99_ZANCU|nr:Ferrochelatase, mitochondrial [Zancudomyces culisetae]|eukprot:OMH86298.1 Ferrochelatase, mitochondrial [Zancudomyces culisetae]